MPGRRHSRAVQLAAVVLARQAGIEAAVAAFGLDARTVRRWEQTVDVPGDEWAAIEATLLARAAEMTARGTTSGLVATLTGAGIAARNHRYGTLIARREARRAAEQESERSPVPLRRREQWDAMHAAIGGHLWGDETAVSAYQRHTVSRLFDALGALDDDRPMPDTDWSSVGWLAVQREALDAPRGEPRDRSELAWHYLPDAEYADDERYQRELDAIAAELRAAADAWLPSHLAELATHRVYRSGRYFTVLTADGERVLSDMTYLPAEYAGHAIDGDSEPLSGPVLDAPTVKEAWMVNVTPEPATPPVPRPPVTVLEVGEHLEDHPSWRRLE